MDRFLAEGRGALIMIVRSRVLSGLTGVVAFFGVALLADGLSGGAAIAASTPNTVQYVVHDNSGLVNYDFQSTNAVNTNVDWPINVVFYNGASVDNIKFALENSYGANSTNRMHIPVTYYGGENHWDEDAGKKGVACPTTGRWTRHYRIYGGYGDSIYSQDIGYWVAATTHKDADECPPIGKRFYDSEEVEENIAAIWANAGYTVHNDLVSWSNPEPYRVEGNHTWNSNGLVTYIDVSCAACRSLR
ncbi:hypothetical protein [Kribbella sp. DT2]|uniref:hypothetical protein n=1 Tax=Kribbella sp. DT2 TaxID=3393427 RepID=UPI003CE9301C